MTKRMSNFSNEINVVKLEDGTYQFTVTQNQYLEIKNALDQIEKKRASARNYERRRKIENQKQEALQIGISPKRKKREKIPIQMNLVSSS